MPPRTQEELVKHYHALLDYVKVWCADLDLDCNEMLSHLITVISRLGMGAQADPVRLLNFIIQGVASAYKIDRDEFLANFLKADLEKLPAVTADWN